MLLTSTDEYFTAVSATFALDRFGGVKLANFIEGLINEQKDTCLYLNICAITMQSET